MHIGGGAKLSLGCGTTCIRFNGPVSEGASKTSSTNAGSNATDSEAKGCNLSCARTGPRYKDERGDVLSHLNTKGACWTMLLEEYNFVLSVIPGTFRFLLVLVTSTVAVAVVLSSVFLFVIRLNATNRCPPLYVISRSL